MGKFLWILLMGLSVASIIYGGFVREVLVYDNLEKLQSLKDIGISIKIPGYEQEGKQVEAQSQWFTEPEMVNAMTFDGISRYKDGRLMSNFPDLKMLKGRMPCPT